MKLSDQIKDEIARAVADEMSPGTHPTTVTMRLVIKEVALRAIAKMEAAQNATVDPAYSLVGGAIARAAALEAHGRAIRDAEREEDVAADANNTQGGA